MSSTPTPPYSQLTLLDPLRPHRLRLLRPVESRWRGAIAQGQGVLAVAVAGHHEPKAEPSLPEKA
jgi:hypothetical protein